MELKDFRPAILYNLLMALDTKIFDVDTGIARDGKLFYKSDDSLAIS